VKDSGDPCILSVGSTNPQGISDPPAGGSATTNSAPKKPRPSRHDALNRLFAFEDLGRGKKQGWHFQLG